MCDNIKSENAKLKIHKPVFVPVVLYRFETWSLALSEEHRRKVFENRVPRRITSSYLHFRERK
jgi:hypothetical protein